MLDVRYEGKSVCDTAFEQENKPQLLLLDFLCR